MVLLTPATATAGSSFNFTVTAEDQFANVATGYAGTLHFTSTDAGATLPINSTLASGVGVFSSTMTIVDNQTITATDAVTSSITGDSDFVDVSPGPTTAFAMMRDDASEPANQDNDIDIDAVDAYGNRTPSYSGTVHWTTSDPNSAQNILPPDATLTLGIGDVEAWLRTPGVQTVTATDTVDSSITGFVTYTILPGTATHFVVTAPANVTSLNAFDVDVTAFDDYSNIATGYVGPVALTSTDGSASLPTGSQSLSSGQGTFSAAMSAPGSWTITVTDSVIVSITGTSDTITAS
jgi:hypothetical protein